jgi:Uma2 family endonuclease
LSATIAKREQTRSAVITEPIYHTEFIDGREIQKPLPKNLHAFTQTYLIIFFSRTLPHKYRVMSELNVLCGPDRLVPDVTLALRTARYQNGDLADPALLCVEIFSPGQTVGDLFDKADRILKAGAPLCWIIWPERRKAWMYSLKDLTEATDTLSVVLEEADRIDVPVSEMWRELD